MSLHLDYDLLFLPPFGSKKITSSELTSLPSVTLITEAVGQYLEVRFLFLIPTVALGKYASHIPNTSGNYPVI